MWFSKYGCVLEKLKPLKLKMYSDDRFLPLHSNPVAYFIYLQYLKTQKNALFSHFSSAEPRQRKKAKYSPLHLSQFLWTLQEPRVITLKFLAQVLVVIARPRACTLILSPFSCEMNLVVMGDL